MHFDRKPFTYSCEGIQSLSLMIPHCVLIMIPHCVLIMIPHCVLIMIPRFPTDGAESMTVKGLTTSYSCTFLGGVGVAGGVDFIGVNCLL